MAAKKKAAVKKTPAKKAATKTTQSAEDKAAAKAKAAEERAAARAEAKAKREAEKAEAKAKREAEREAKRKAREEEKAAAKAAREAARMPEQNGIRQPKPDGLCGKAWAIFDKISAKNGAPASIAESLEMAEKQGLKATNVRAEYARWRKFHGVEGRIEPPEAVKKRLAKKREAEKAEG